MKIAFCSVALASILVPAVGESSHFRASRQRSASTARRNLSGRRRPRLLGDEEMCMTTGSDEAFKLAMLGEDAYYDDTMYIYLFEAEDEFGSYAVEMEVALLAKAFADSQLLGDIDGYTFSQEEQTFGAEGEYTEEMLMQHELLKSFWKTDDYGPPILLVGVHSSPLESKENMEYAVKGLVWYDMEYDDVSEEEISLIADDAMFAIESIPNEYLNPTLSETGEAQAVFGTLGYENSTTVFIGDGMLYYDEFNDLGHIGSDILHAHEFAHGVQIILGIEDFGGDELAYAEYDLDITAERNRELELEADAMGAYALAHEQGRNFDVNDLLDTAEVSFHIGDCDVDYEGHHGTPEQRKCATLWGADEGLDMAGDPLSMREFRDLFLESYELILALDPSVCSATDSTDEADGMTEPEVEPEVMEPEATPSPIPEATLEVEPEVEPEVMEPEATPSPTPAAPADIEDPTSAAYTICDKSFLVVATTLFIGFDLLLM